MKIEDLKQKLLKENKAFRTEYRKHELKRQIALKIIKERTNKGITQKELASIVKTKQPSIARLENGEYLPSLSFLKRIADALKTNIPIVVGDISYQNDNELTTGDKVIIKSDVYTETNIAQKNKSLLPNTLICNPVNYFSKGE